MWNAASAIIRVQNRSFCGFHRHRLWRLNITRMYLTGMGQDGVRQHQAQALILAEKTDHFFMKEHRSVRILAIPIFITVPQ